MKLLVKAMKQPTGDYLMLCDEQGNPLPNQMMVEYSNTVDSLAQVTVTFIVDGDNIKLVESR